MSATLYRQGARYTWTNSTGSTVASGSVVVLNSGATGFIGIALDSIANLASGELSIGGPDEVIHTLAKNTGEAYTDAEPLYWDATNSRLTSVSTSNTWAGRCYGTAASADTTCHLILNAK